MDRLGGPVIVPFPVPGVAGRPAAGSPPGPRAIDGVRLLAAAVAFSRELRSAGLAIDLGAVIDFARALELVEIGDREEVHAAGASVFVRHREERPVYDAVFRHFWRTGTRMGGPTIEVPTVLVEERTEPRRRPKEPEPRRDEPPPEPRHGRDDDQLEPAGNGHAGDEGLDGLVISPRAYSRDEVDRHRQFDRMTAAELLEAERFIDLLTPNLELRRTPRRELHSRGQLLAPRAMFRRNLKTGGDPLEWLWQRAVRRPRTLVVLCDISGSMERHSRILLRFTQALASSAVRTEAFVFGTKLTRVTRLLRGRDRNQALARVAEATTDWSGGTRIGESLREFNQRWARRVLRSSSVVVIVSDGWDRGEPALVGQEMARLQRSCHRLIWLNPLASAPGYRPLAGGMAAALPFVDDFVPAGTLASLERLAVLLSSASVRSPSRRRSAEAQAGPAEVQAGPAEAQAGLQTQAVPASRRSTLRSPEATR